VRSRRRPRDAHAGEISDSAKTSTPMPSGARRSNDAERFVELLLARIASLE
jgi:hypothetical protein